MNAATARTLRFLLDNSCRLCTMASSVGVLIVVLCLPSIVIHNIVVSGKPTLKVLQLNSPDTISHVSSSRILYVPAKSNVTLRLQTSGLSDGAEVAFTTRQESSANQLCNASELFFPFSSDISKTGVIQVKVSLPPLNSSDQYYYLCISEDNGSDLGSHQDPLQWIHQGDDIKFRTLSRDGFQDVAATSILGFRAEGDRVTISEEGVSLIPADQEVKLLLFGLNLTEQTTIAFTSVKGLKGSSCDELPTISIIRITEEALIGENVAQLNIELPIPPSSSDFFYFCVKRSTNLGEGIQWVHQGDEPWLRIKSQGRLLPLWLQCAMIGGLLLLSGLFSGLNLGLMALDKTELQVIESCGTDREKKYAKSISPLRKRGNYLLCSLLLGNVLVNSTLTILLDDLTSGIIAIIVSTMSIVLFGEIIPQAICSRHGLAVGAQTVYITKFFMVITFPLSYPISLILDHVLGEEIGNVYDRERLMEFIRLTKDYNKLANEEVNIISGALELKKKTVSQVMTRIEDVFMVPYDAVLDFETMSEIMKQGYTRIPVYDSDRNNIIALLHAKDLAFVDPDDNTPLKTLCEFYNHPVNFVFEDETLDVMLNEFKKGRSHMAFVRHINTEGDGDPFYEISGVITLEDVIEEIIQSEIIDETDVLTDNRKKQRRKEAQIKQDFSDFAKIGGGQQGQNVISPQLALATYQYLSTSVDPFKKHVLSETVVRRLMAQNIFFALKLRSKDDYNAPCMTLYQAGKPADYFILILEGRVRVTVGKENLVFEAGPFTYFGIPAISLTPTTADTSMHSVAQSSCQSLSLSPVESAGSKHNFTPDYTVVAVADTLYMKVPRAVYLAAYRATLMERQQKMDPNVDDMLRSEWDNVLNAVNAIGHPSGPLDLTIPSMASTSSLAAHLPEVHNQASPSPLHHKSHISVASPHATGDHMLTADHTLPRQRAHKQRHSIGTPRERSSRDEAGRLHPTRKDANGDLSPNRIAPVPNSLPNNVKKFRSISQLEMRDLGPPTQVISASQLAEGESVTEPPCERTKLLHPLEKITS